MSLNLQDMSDAMAAVVEAAAPSIVRVEARRRMPASGIVFSADGLIVTANHVVDRDEGIRIGLPDGSVAAASVVGRDPMTDLALLRADASGLAPAAWASGDTMRVGHLVLAMARPGRGVQSTLGVISALGDAWRTHGGGQIDAYVQTDVVMYPGYSGGPLVSASGSLLGLNTSAFLRGISLTLPSATVIRVASTLQTHGRMRRGYLGISAQPVRLPAAIAEALGQEIGLLLMAVEPGSPAEDGGLLLGDTLVALDGAPVYHMDDLMALLSGDRVGKAVTARVVRGGQMADVQVTIGERAHEGTDAQHPEGERGRKWERGGRHGGKRGPGQGPGRRGGRRGGDQPS